MCLFPLEFRADFAYSPSIFRPRDYLIPGLTIAITHGFVFLPSGTVIEHNVLRRTLKRHIFDTDTPLENVFCPVQGSIPKVGDHSLADNNSRFGLVFSEGAT